MKERSIREQGSQAGFALVLALLALVLLTFLGLTLAATTSTELQIATNHRWSQQALYNAEAGIEAARLIIAWAVEEEPNVDVLFPPRPGAWAYGDATTPAGTYPDYKWAECDERGRVGYGEVLRVPQPGSSGVRVPFLQVSSFGGHSMNGAFTLFVRRDLDYDAATGLYSDERGANLIITSEGIAPGRQMYDDPTTGADDAADLASARRLMAVRTLEIKVQIGLGELCEAGGQEGVSGTGDNYNPCAPLNRDTVADSLRYVFGDSGGTLEAK